MMSYRLNCFLHVHIQFDSCNYMYGNCPETMYLLSIVHYLIVILVPTLLKHTHIYLHTHMHTTQAEQQAKQAETQEEQSPSSPSSQQQTNQTQRSVVGPMFISPPQHTHSHTPPPPSLPPHTVPPTTANSGEDPCSHGPENNCRKCPHRGLAKAH